MQTFKEQVNESTQMRIVDLLPKKVKRMLYRYKNQDKYKGAILMMKHLTKDPDVISRGLSKARIQSIAADHFGLNHREFAKILNRKTRYEEAPPGMADTVKKFKADGMDDDEAFALAWSIYNKAKEEVEELKEAPLGPADLAGKNSDTGELRVNILKKLIKAGTPLKMVPKKGYPKDLFTVTDKELALDNLDQFTRDGKSFSIGEFSGKAVMSNHIFKSRLFGGEKGGAGPGTKETAETEAAQALWCAAVTAEGMNGLEYFTDEILSKHTKRAFTGGTNLKTMLNISDSWKESAYKTAVVLIRGGFINKNHTFHRDDRKMNEIYSKKKDAYRNNDMKNLNNDKWNPGDIWALTSDFVPNDIPIFTVRGLNLYMLEKYRERSIVGISLKKIEKGEGKFKEYNLKVPVPVDNYKLQSLHVKAQNRGSFWSTKECTILSKEGKVLACKANKALGTMKIEIKGKGSRAGSIGYGPISDSVEIVKIPKLPTQQNLVKTAKMLAPGRRKKPNARAANDFYKRVNAYEPMSRKEFDTELARKDAAWVHAKLGGMAILDAFNSTPIKANRLLTRIVNYAASKSEDASVYVKVSE